MDPIIWLVFAVVYVGMVLGGLPGLAIDRTGIALLGAIALLATGRLDATGAWDSIDVPTIALLLGLMVVSAQFRLGGTYAALTRHLAAAEVAPPVLLALVIGAAGLLSALLANDIICLAMTPLLIEGCTRRGLRCKPFLLGLACAANVGSAATLIGNPQNMLIGQKLQLSFAGYLLDGVVPAVLGCAATWLVLVWLTRGHWHEQSQPVTVEAPPFHPWQTLKGALVLFAIVAAFLFAPYPREIVALAGAGVLLLSRRMHTRGMLGLVDWPLLVLFCGLFVVNHALAMTGGVERALIGLRGAGVELEHPGWLFGATVVLSNLVSNVPAVMLLLPAAEQAPFGGPILALASTLAGNLFIVGSIANIIVVEQARLMGVRITWREHARIGVPVTGLTLLIAGGWLAVRAYA